MTNDFAAGAVLGHIYSKDPDTVAFGVVGAVLGMFVVLVFGLCYEWYKRR